MIKDYQYQTIDEFTQFCLNPRCQSPSHRVCKWGDLHYSNPQCKPWMLSQSQYKSKNKKTPIHHCKGYTLDLSGDTLHTILNLHQSKAQFRSHMKGMIEEMKKIANQSFSVMESVLEMKLEHIFDPICECHAQLGKLLSTCSHLSPELTSYKIQDFLRNSLWKSCSTQPATVLFDKRAIEEPLKKMKKITDELIQKMIQPKDQANSDIMIGHSQIQQMEKYLTEPDDEDFNKKIIKLTNLMRVSRRELSDKEIRIKAGILKCSLCTFSIRYQLKKREVSVKAIKDLSNHLTTTHLEIVGYNYEHFISKRSNYQTNIQNIIYLMTNYSFESLEIVHSTGRKFFHFSQFSYKKLQVEIVLQNEHPQANMKYIYHSNSSDFINMLVIAAFVLFNPPNSPDHCFQERKNICVYISKAEAEKGRKACQKLNLTNVTFVDCNRALDESGFPAILEEDDDFRSQDTTEYGFF